MAITEPLDKSMPPEIMMTALPSAKNPSSTVWRMISSEESPGFFQYVWPGSSTIVAMTTASQAKISLNSTDDHNLRRILGAVGLMPFFDC